MKLIIFGYLLLGIGHALADTDGLTPSEKCQTEVNKYSGCLEGMDEKSINQINNSKALKDFCKIFASDKCKDFVNDINITESGCITEDKSNELDLYTGLIFISMRIAYSAYCARDSDGNVCPFSQYLVDNFSKIDENTTELSHEGKNALASDCKDIKCYERMISLQTISDNFSEITSGMGDTNENNSSMFSNSTRVMEKFYDSYYNKNCDIIDGKSSSSSIIFRKVTFSFISFIILSIIILI